MIKMRLNKNLFNKKNKNNNKLKKFQCCKKKIKMNNKTRYKNKKVQSKMKK